MTSIKRHRKRDRIHTDVLNDTSHARSYEQKTKSTKNDDDKGPAYIVAKEALSRRNAVELVAGRLDGRAFRCICGERIPLTYCPWKKRVFKHISSVRKLL